MKQTITINNKQYDAHTGLLIDSQVTSATPRPTKPVVSSSSIHSSAQKSRTLKRAVVKKTVQSKPPARRSNDVVRFRQDIMRSPKIARFAPHPVTVPTPSASPQDIISVKHASLANAHRTQAAAKSIASAKRPAPTPAQTIKHEAISAALSAPSRGQKSHKQSLKKKFPRVFSVASASLAVLILGGYLTYLNMPTISIRVAAAQAGINATYPDYRPDGYRLAGPIAYRDNEVSMQFAANAGPQNFTIKEVKNGWDSSAVLENYVKPKTDGEYVTYSENGLTIYTYDNNAAWVNGGILYTIDGDAPLSNEQIRRIATSL